MTDLIPFVPLDLPCEQLVLGWRISHPMCPHPRCWCRRTPIAMHHGLDPMLYQHPAHQHIARAMGSIDALGEIITPSAFEMAMKLDGQWERCGGWSYWSVLVAASNEALTCEVEAAAMRLVDLKHRRNAVERLVAIAEAQPERDGALAFVRL